MTYPAQKGDHLTFVYTLESLESTGMATFQCGSVITARVVGETSPSAVGKPLPQGE